MTPKTKKIVAREILIAFGTPLVIVLAFLIIQWRISWVGSQISDLRSTLSDVEEFEKRFDFFHREVVATNASQQEVDSIVSNWLDKEMAKDERFRRSASDYNDELVILINSVADLYDPWSWLIFYVLLIVYPVRFAILTLVWAIRTYFKSE